MSVCKWLLDNSPEVVTRLERESNLMVIVNDTEKLHILDMRLLVAKTAAVYEVKEYSGKEQLFFSVEDGDDFNPAFLSVVTPENDSLNYAKNVGNLLYYPWFSNKMSSLIFHKLSEGKAKDIATGLASTDKHPLAKK